MNKTNFIILVLAIVVSVVLGIFISHKWAKTLNSSVIEDQEKAIKKLQRTIIVQDSIKVAEHNLREQEDKKRGILIDELRASKKKDSLTYVHSIRTIMKRYQNNTREESTKLLLEEYEKAMADTTAH